MRFKTNGWQRLWIVTSVLYLCVTIPITFAKIDWPETTNIEKEFVNATYLLIDEADGKEIKIDITLLVEEFIRRGLLANPETEVDTMMAEKDWVGLAERAILKNKNKINFSEIRNTYDSDLEKITSERKEIVLFCVVIWFVPIVVLYLLGLSIRWIVRGFKPN